MRCWARISAAVKVSNTDIRYVVGMCKSAANSPEGCFLMSKSGKQPVHPGEILLRDFIEPAGLNPTSTAKALGVTPARINDIVLGRRGITADTALRLARYFGGDPMAWLVRQAEYDLRVAEIEGGKAIENAVTPRARPLKKGGDRPDR
jgi:addiction module HigA family antidote